MAECELIGGCLFFNTSHTGGSVEDMYKANYCQRDNRKCARFIVWLVLNDRTLIPDGLYPNMLDRVESIVADVHLKKAGLEKEKVAGS